MALQKFLPSGDAPTMSMKRLTVTSKVREKVQLDVAEQNHDVEVDLREVYFLIMHFLSSGPCQRTCVQLWNELLEHQLLPRRYHAWYSRSGMPSGDEDDSGLSFPLSYNQLVERFPHIENEHLVKLLKQLISSSKSPSFGVSFGNAPNAADVPTLLGKGSFSLLMDDRDKTNEDRRPPLYMRWPHMKANQVQGLRLREIGGGFTRHHRAPSIRAACYAIVKPSTMVQKMQNIKRIRGHRNAVYCATFDRSGRHVITGSDDRLVKIWSMETAYCLASCRGHDGDITDLAVSTNNALVASSSNDCIIRVWRMPDGLPISVLRGHTGAVTAIAFSPRPSAVYQLLSSSDDGTCRIWDARHSQSTPRIYIPRPHDSAIGRSSGPSSSNVPQSHQIFCCAFNASGTIFVTGSSDNLARVWNASKPNLDDSDQPNHEIDVLSGHENDVNYVQFSGCAVASRFSTAETGKEDNIPKFKNSWFNHDNIVTCSRDGSAIIWISKSRRSHGKTCRWTRAYHLRVPPPPMPPQPQRGGPRQRILPTPRGVNMIVWSLDNRFVLAAIMDCRICVWNASDGSLVHSLTGHTDSTYVLDVHPFNPRIAMSAGYDGKTIVWDIWEGKPIRTYDMSHFKLVDGKFSPDGTSIILSDDVGQLYILSTGQGESQNDAKYDQFFLGDYRPLIQDTHGGVLDQETQLVPYRRNMQDLLCDSAMIPYPEPYQTEYQQRRLGALGIEWCPSSLRLAVGPDFSLDPEYQMFPLPDLDMLIEPLPEVIDAMDWEFENEVHSDDTDSDFNINEDNSSGGEKECSSSNASGDPGCSTDDSEGEGTHMDGNHRLKRKKQKTDTEIMTSSGRRVKRRNLDEGADNALSSHRSRRRKSSRKASSRRSSKSKSSRPRRAAARNALHLFSRINGVPTDGEEDSVEGDSSGSESSLLESISDESNRDTHNDHRRYLKGKEVSLNEADDMNIHELPETHTDAVNRRRLVLKLPVRDKSVRESTEYKFENEAEFVASSSKSAQQAIDVNNRSCSEEPQYNSGIVNHYKNDRRRAILQIQWGRVRARSARGKRVGKAASSNANASSVICLNDKQKYVSGYEKEDKDFGTLSPPSEIHKDEDKIDNLTVINENCVASASEPHNTSENGIGPSASGNCRDSKDEALTSDMDAQDTTVGSINHSNGPDHLSESYIGFPSVSTRVRSKRTSRDLESPVKNETKSLVPKSGVFSGTAISDSSNGEQNVVLAADNTLAKSNEGDNGVQEINTQDDHNLISHDSQEPQSHQDKMYKAFYRRSRSHRAVSNAGDGSGQGEPTSNGSNIDLNLAVDLINETNEPAHTTYSLDMEQATSNTNHGWNNIIIPHVHVRSPRNGSSSRGQPTEEEHGSRSKTTVGLRSTRNRRVSSNHVHERSPPIRKKSSQSSAKGSWLLLSLPEEGCRYIPQQADEVVYLRQGHQEYIEYRRSRESGPWASLNGQVRAVEYCRIQNLEYSTVPGSGDSCCKLTLQFVDPASSVVGKSFKLSLPEVTGFPDFLVERTRFDAAMTRNWTHRDKCRVWWKSDGEGDFGGSWWDGRILSVKPKSTQFLDSPWERYTIQYKNDPAETHLHSPWELFDADTVWEQPHIDESKRIKLLSAFEKLLQSGNKNQDRYGVRELSKVSNKTKFINRFPVPLTLELIHSRLDNTYYRTLEALEHDMTVLLSNASSFFEKDAVLSGKIMRLSEWFTRTFSSL